MLVDSHCHLNFPDFKGDLPTILKRARQAGVTTCLTVNTRLNEALELQEIADAYPGVYCSVGVHPHEAATHSLPDLLTQLRELTRHPKVVALGETGIDLYYEHSPIDDQITSFQTHLQAGIELDLPVIIHTREGDKETLACLDKYPEARGVFHCFTGSKEMAQAGLDRGYLISFSGIITFKNSQDLRDIVNYVPLDRMLVETDAPFLAPMPHRGSRNEPAYTRHTAEMVAQIKGVPYEKVAQQTTQNFFYLFNRVNQMMFEEGE